MSADKNASETPEVIRLFPTFIWSDRLRPAADEAIHAAILGVLGDLRRELPPLPRGEAWQSGHGLHRVAELAPVLRQNGAQFGRRRPVSRDRQECQETIASGSKAGQSAAWDQGPARWSSGWDGGTASGLRCRAWRADGLDRPGDARSGRLPDVAMMQAADFGNLPDDTRLGAGYYLAAEGRDFIIVDGHERIGQAWRQRWDSRRLFTPAAYDGLPGMLFPAPPDAYPRSGVRPPNLTMI
jgi:hypothetical protein